MEAQEVAQYVLEPFRDQMRERIENGRAMSPIQLAREMGLAKTTVHRAIVDGRVPAFRLGNLWRIKPERIPVDVLEWWTRPKPETLWPTGALVYFLEGVEGFVKIGFTANLRERVKDLQVGCPMPIRLLAHCVGDEAMEREYHRRFCRARLSGEWFQRCPEIEAEIERLTAANP